LAKPTTTAPRASVAAGGRRRLASAVRMETRAASSMSEASARMTSSKKSHARRAVRLCVAVSIAEAP